MKEYWFEAFDDKTDEPFTGTVYAKDLDDAREKAYMLCKEHGFDLAMVMDNRLNELLGD